MNSTIEYEDGLIDYENTSRPTPTREAKIGETIERLRREAHARKIERLTEEGYFDDCYFAPGVTPQNLVSIVGHNLITKDRIEELILEKIAAKYER